MTRRIVTLVDTLAAGGAERVAVELACALDRDRYTPYVIVGRSSGPLAQLLDAAGVEWTLLGRRSRLDPRPWLRARRLLRGASLLHSHKFGSNVWGVLLARSTGVPLVVHEHNFSAEPSWMRSRIDRWWIGPAAQRVLCVSESVATVERASGIPDERIVVVPNGVRMDRALDRGHARTQLGLDGAEFFLGTVGRLRPEKAIDVAIDALAELRASGSSARLCIVGSGPCEPALRAQVGRLGLDEAVVFAGEHADAARLAGAFDVALLPSHWEGMPLAALEAMAAGTPLVASAVGGLPDLLSDGAGLLVPPGDPSALARSVAGLERDPAVRALCGEAGQARVAVRHDFAEMVRRVESLYDDVLDAPSRTVARLLPMTSGVTRMDEVRRTPSRATGPRHQPVGALDASRPASGFHIDLGGVAGGYGTPQDAAAWLELAAVRREHVLPVTVLQLGLGAWQLAVTDGSWMPVFAGVARWAVLDMDGHGRFAHHAPMPHTYAIDPPWHSAMAQGLGVSLLVRAASELGDETMLAEAARAAASLLDDASNLVSRTEAGPVLEEYPAQPRPHVLNGWIWALYGLHDLACADRVDRELAERCALAVTAGCDALATMLPRYVLAGGWSRYDLYPHPLANVASPFYQRLHVDMLRALHRAQPRGPFAAHADRFERALEQPHQLAVAVARKVTFRMVRPRSRRVA